MSEPHDETIATCRRLVQRLVDGDIPAGSAFDACRAVLRLGGDQETVFSALSVLLEGALANPTLAIDDTQVVVSLLKALVRGTVTPGELL